MKGIILKNKKLKLTALAISIALWYFVAGQSGTEVAFLVPLVFKGVPSDMLITNMPPDEIEVRVTGPKLVIQNLSPSQIKVEVDLSRAEQGGSSYNISPSNVKIPSGVQVKRIRPGAVDVRMERIVRVALPLKVKLNGTPARGYRLSGLAVKPEVVEVSGLKKELGSLQAVYTTPVDISGLTESRTFSARVDTSEMDLARVDLDRVSVLVKIERDKTLFRPRGEGR